MLPTLFMPILSRLFSLLPARWPRHARARLLQAALLGGVMALAQAGQGAHWEVRSYNTDDPYYDQVIGYTPPVAYYEVGGYAGMVLMQTFPPPGNTVRIDGGTNGGSSIWMGGWLAYYYPRGMTGYVDSVGHSWEAIYVGNCPTGQFLGPVSHRCRPICTAGTYLSKSFGNCRIRARCPANQSCDIEDIDDDQGQRCPAAGNPVTTATGNKFQTEPDLDWAPGQTFTRYYNSGSHIDVGLGSGWRHTFSRRITVSVDMAPLIAVQIPSAELGSAPASEAEMAADTDPDWGWAYTVYDTASATRYALEREDGSRFLFDWNGQFIGAQAGNRYQLTINKDGQGVVTGFTLKDGLNIETYNRDGRLITITAPNGLITTLAYTVDGSLELVTDNLGHKLQFFYRDRLHINNITVNLFTSNIKYALTYGYDTQGHLISATYADASQRKYFYEGSTNSNLLTGIQDENSNRYVTWRYNADGQAISSEHAGGVDKFGLSFGGDNTAGPRWTDVTDPLGTVRRYTFSKRAGSWLLDGNSQPGGSGCAAASNGLTYDTNGNVASRTDFNGNVTKYGFDLTRNLETSRTEAFGTAQARTITTVWHPTWRLPASITEPNRVTTFDYDAVTSNLKKKTITSAGVSRIWSWTYGNFGQVATSTDPSGKITTYTYDAQGNLATITNPASQITQFPEYDANGNLKKMIAATGIATTFSYDLRNRLKTRQTGSELTTFTYDLAGQLKRIDFADGSSLSYDYDPAHRLTDIRDNRNGRVHYELNNDGSLKREDRYDPDGTLATGLAAAATQRNLPNAINQGQ